MPPWTARSLALSVFRVLPGWLRRRLVAVLVPRFTVGAVVLLQRPSAELLLVRQRHSTGWALAGGLLRRHEPPELAVARETGEELGIRLTPEALGAPTVWVDAPRRRVDVIYRPAAAEFTPTSRDPEVLEARWFRPDRLPPLTIATADILRTVGVTRT